MYLRQNNKITVLDKGTDGKSDSKKSLWMKNELDSVVAAAISIFGAWTNKEFYISSEIMNSKDPILNNTDIIQFK